MKTRRVIALAVGACLMVFSITAFGGLGTSPSKNTMSSQGAKKIDIEKYYFQPNRNIPKGISNGEVVLGTLVTPKGSFVQKMTFQKGVPVSVQRKPLPPNYKKISIRGAEKVTIHTVRVTGINSTGGRTPLQDNENWDCEFDCYFGEGTCMICGDACTNGHDWRFGIQTYIDC